MDSLHSCKDYLVDIKNFKVCSYFNCSNVLIIGIDDNYEDQCMIVDCCNDKNVIERNGFFVCSNCGVIETTEKIYDDDPYGFQNGKDSTYLHATVSEMYPESSMGTSINGNSRLAKIQNWNKMPYKERVIWEVSNDLKSRLANIFSDTVINQAIAEYKTLYAKTSIHRGKNKKGLIASCVYFAARDNLTKITPKKLAELMDIDIGVLNKCITLYIENTEFNSMKISRAEDYAQEYCNKYDLDFKIQKLLIKMCNAVEESDILSSSVPQNLCLACLCFIFIEMKKEINLKQICCDYNVSINTISKLVEVLKNNKNYIFSQLK